MDVEEYMRQQVRIEDFKVIQKRIEEIDQVLGEMEHFGLIKFESITSTIDKTMLITNMMKEDLINMLEKRKSYLLKQLAEI